MNVSRILASLAFLALASSAAAAGEGAVGENPHREYVKRYEGTKT